MPKTPIYDPVRRYFLGVDPGLSGALVLYDPVDQKLVIQRMPTFEQRVKYKGNKAGRKRKRSIDAQALSAWLDGYASSIRYATIERVHAMPGQGVVSMFSFGFSTGVLYGLLAAHQIEFQETAPAEWKRVMRVTADKATSVAQAQRLWPKYADQLRHDGVAEAALIAAYGSAMQMVLRKRQAFEWRTSDAESKQPRRVRPARAAVPRR